MQDRTLVCVGEGVTFLRLEIAQRTLYLPYQREGSERRGEM